jgi:hypothetical protein
MKINAAGQPFGEPCALSGLAFLCNVQGDD